jgi:hypothetical protein
MQGFVIGTRVRPAESRQSDDAVVPFQCENCEFDYDDYPALIVVDTVEGRLRYCTDACAEQAGWTEAVRHRWNHEVENICESIIFVPAH